MARTLLVSAALVLAALVSAVASSAADAPLAPLDSQGRWFTDRAGRVVQLRGVNEVYKSAPFYPAADGFGADDARFLAANGFNVVRLGVMFQALMPAPGVIDRDYIEGIARSVRDLRRAGIFVLLDFHQDGFAPKYRGAGFPDWMALDDGLPNPPVGFPDYYTQNRALQRAFESFWANRAGPDGVGLQDSFVRGFTAVVRRFAADRHVIGYETFNEPWPGSDWPSCLSFTAGCPALEQSRIVPFARKVTAAARTLTRRQRVFIEPFVLFNFGTPTSLPGRGSGNALAAHSYAADPAGEARVVDFAADAAERDGAPVLVTEFGATEDPATLRRLTSGFDRRLLPWIFWAYNENVITDRSGPAGLDRLDSLAAFAELVRPYPIAVAGTPQELSFDRATKVLHLRFSTRRPGGGRYGRRLPSVLSTPRLAYPDGYTVEATGATVTSAPCAPRLTLRTRRFVREVAVTVRPASAPASCG